MCSELKFPVQDCSKICVLKLHASEVSVAVEDEDMLYMVLKKDDTMGANLETPNM